MPVPAPRSRLWLARGLIALGGALCAGSFGLGLLVLHRPTCSPPAPGQPWSTACVGETLELVRRTQNTAAFERLAHPDRCPVEGAVDSAGRALRIECTAGGVEVASDGSDGIPGTEDDIRAR